MELLKMKLHMYLAATLAVLLFTRGASADWKRELVETKATMSTFVDRSEGRISQVNRTNRKDYQLTIE
jgi:hypothetical protein